MAVRDVVMAAAGQGDEAIYVDDVFSTYLYTGNGSTQTINNGIDLAGEGGMVWIKDRVFDYFTNVIDTARGSSKVLFTASTQAEMTDANRISSFSSTGFSLGSNASVNKSGDTYASWTFRKAPKFFDVVTYTGTGVTRTVPHSLGSVPGMLIIKRLNSSGSEWWCYHRSVGQYNQLRLNSTDGKVGFSSIFNNTLPTTSTFTVGGSSDVNAVNGTYVAYLFAHDAGGFGADGSENVISCGSYVGNGSATGPVINLGYEPQFVIIKAASANSSWQMLDVMRGITTGGNDAVLNPEASSAEFSSARISVTATGFSIDTASGGVNSLGVNYIYIAIRRPHKPPTSGTEVFALNAESSSSITSFFTTNFVTDMLIHGYNRSTYNYPAVTSRFSQAYMETNSTSAESFSTNNYFYDSNIGVKNNYTTSGAEDWWYAFRRAPGFFDEVCYTGTGVARTVAHNLGVVPELMFVKARQSSSFGVSMNWTVYSSSLGNTKAIFLNSNSAFVTDFGDWNDTSPTSSVFTVGFNGRVNEPAKNYVAYLFASLPGISKVGSYTGNGSSQTINCGFTTGARFFLVKATSTTGSWWVYDSARGIVAAADPALQLNSTAAEVTSADAVDPTATGIIVNQEATCSINASGVQYLFLAIS